MFKHYLKTALRFLRRNTLYTGINALGLSILLTLMVLLPAVLFMWLAKPSAEMLFQTSLDIIPSNVAIYIPVYLFLTLFIGLVSGLYASSYLSRMKRFK